MSEHHRRSWSYEWMPLPLLVFLIPGFPCLGERCGRAHGVLGPSLGLPGAPEFGEAQGPHPKLGDPCVLIPALTVHSQGTSGRSPGVSSLNGVMITGRPKQVNAEST